jgi:hypothetical protein
MFAMFLHNVHSDITDSIQGIFNRFICVAGYFMLHQQKNYYCYYRTFNSRVLCAGFKGQI